MPDPAPLVATAGAPVPAGAQAEWFVGVGGARIRAALFVPPGTARGSVVVNPGRTEPIEKYFEVVQVLNAQGFVVLVHDWRGQGLSHRVLSDRRLGHARGFDEFMSDFQALLATFALRLPKPWIALGHSMGGCLTLLALAQGEARFSAAILSAPMLGIRTGSIPHTVASGLARVAVWLGQGGRVFAGASAAAEPTAFAANTLTHDEARYRRNEAQVLACPDLALGGPTWGWLDFAFRATHLLRKGSGTARISIPVTIVDAGRDALVDTDASQAIAKRIVGSRYVRLPEAYHEILQETDAIQAGFWHEFDALSRNLA